MVSARLVAPTLVDAVRVLANDDVRGFVFTRGDGRERLYTFQEIAVEAERRAGQIAARGLRKGDRMALILPEGDDFVLSFLGALFAGVVPVPIHPQLSFKNIESYHDTVAHIAQASGAQVLLTTTATKPFVEPALARAPTLRAVVTLDELAVDSRHVDADVSADDLAFLQFTSGSTSRPKGVMVTHANLAANAEAFMIHGISRDERLDKGVSWLPLFHDMGLIGFVAGPLFTNIPCVFMPTASFVRSPRLWLEKISEHRGTITYAPSFAYSLVAKRLKDKDVEGLDLSRLRVAGCGAEPIRARALRDFAEKLKPAGFDPRAFLPSYGMAEATLAITFVTMGDGLRTDEVDGKALTAGHATKAQDGEGQTLVDCGVPFPGHELAIVDEAGRRLGDRLVGQIVVRGPSVTRGYFQEKEMTDQLLRPLAADSAVAEGEAGDLWLHTGDLGYLADGRLFICGRLKDIIIVRGRNYYPTDIEWAVGELGLVRRGNVVAFSVDLDGEERLVLCCEATAGESAPIQDAVRACVAAQFGLTVHEVVISPPASLPRTSSGKPQRRKTRQLYLDDALPRARGMHSQPPVGSSTLGTSSEPAGTQSSISDRQS